jgi:hypothetical protein
LVFARYDLYDQRTPPVASPKHNADTPTRTHAHDRLQIVVRLLFERMNLPTERDGTGAEACRSVGWRRSLRLSELVRVEFLDVLLHLDNPSICTVARS